MNALNNGMFVVKYLRIIKSIFIFSLDFKHAIVYRIGLRRALQPGTAQLGLMMDDDEHPVLQSQSGGLFGATAAAAAAISATRIASTEGGAVTEAQPQGKFVIHCLCENMFSEYFWIIEYLTVCLIPCRSSCRLSVGSCRYSHTGAN